MLWVCQFGHKAMMQVSYPYELVMAKPIPGASLTSLDIHVSHGISGKQSRAELNNGRRRLTKARSFAGKVESMIHVRKFKTTLKIMVLEKQHRVSTTLLKTSKPMRDQRRHAIRSFSEI